MSCRCESETSGDGKTPNRKLRRGVRRICGSRCRSDWVGAREIESVHGPASALGVGRVVIEANPKVQDKVPPNAPVILKECRIVMGNEPAAGVDIVRT